MDDRPGGDAREQALLVEQCAHASDGLGVRDQHFPVELRDVEDRRHVAVLERAQAHDGVAGKRLGRGDDDVGEALAEPLAGPHQRPTGAEPCNEHVDAVERLGDLGAGALIVSLRVGPIAVLEGHEVARVLRRQLLRKANGAVRAFGSRRLHDLGAVELEQPAALLGHVLGHHAGERVPLQLCDERERDSCVAARRLEQLPAGLELATSLGILDHRKRDAVLDRAGRVLALELGVNPDFRLRGQSWKLDERGSSDQVEQAAGCFQGQFLKHRGTVRRPWPGAE